MIVAALDRVEEELDDRHVRVRADRRGHSHRDRAPRHRDRGRRPARSCTPAGAATTRSRSTCGSSSGARAASRSSASTSCRRCSLRRAEEAGDSYLPGYTHLQRAQPVLLAHHLLAHFWALGRDVDRWRDCLDAGRRVAARRGRARGFEPAARSRSSSPTSSASRARSRTRSTRSPTATSSPRRCSSPTLTQVHLSRLGEEIVLWSTEEFGFIRLADAYSTGSSMLPQKKNPDIAELARGKAGRLIGDLTGFLATLKGLPLAYNRDLQEDKEPLFDALDTCALSLLALAG